MTDVLIAMKRKACDCTRKCEGHFDRGVLLARKILYRKINARWMVGFRVYIEWNIFSGLEKGLCVPFFKSRVTSRKLTVCLFTSIVILRPFLLNGWYKASS